MTGDLRQQEHEAVGQCSQLGLERMSAAAGFSSFTPSTSAQGAVLLY